VRRPPAPPERWEADEGGLKRRRRRRACATAVALFASERGSEEEEGSRQPLDPGCLRSTAGGDAA
jgi:hypothetical protein